MMDQETSNDRGQGDCADNDNHGGNNFQEFTNDMGMTFVWIAPGTFMMGSPASEPERFDDETLHPVKLSRGYYMQTTPVTQGQWQAMIGDNPSYFNNCGSNCPMELVSWEDAQKFIQKLNQRWDRITYSLPTEAQWEYAARAGATTPFYFGSQISTDQANYDGNYPMPGDSMGDYREKTVPVGSFPPNAWGLYDIHGNVREWCQDWYGEYPSGPVADPKGPSSGTSRVFRGGSWDSLAGYCRSACRFGRAPSRHKYHFLGFRLAGN